MAEDKTRTARWCPECNEYRQIWLSQKDKHFIGKCLYCDKVLFESNKNPIEKAPHEV